jgi:tRNA modification GTPase
MGTTIAAIASPPGCGARGILRLSGPLAREIVHATWGGREPVDLSKRGSHIGRFRDGRGEQPLLLLWMPGPRSFTREDVAEFHLPGSPPLLQAALACLLDLGAVPAAPGEFTRRAFLSGRIDLTRAEGVLALVTARNESERRAGRALLSGGLSDRVDALRHRLEDLRALVEASLDFDARDTGHVPEAEITALAREVRTALKGALGWETARAGAGGEPRIVLSGAPNAGKSALFNRLAGSDDAIVSPAAGTTRDVLVAEIDLEGVACRLFDTAGIAEEPPRGAIDRAGQEAGRSVRESTDLLLWVVDATESGSAREVPARDSPGGAEVLLVWNKIDLPRALPEPPERLASGLAWIGTSALSGAGIEELRASLARAVGGGGRIGAIETRDADPATWSRGGESSGLARELALRHRAALERATQSLDHGLSAWGGGAPLDILAEHLRRATESLDEITGASATEVILDRIFARFCLGK